MAINFNKLFLQNLLPKTQSATERTHGVTNYDIESDIEDELQLAEFCEASSRQDDRNADKLEKTLEILRKIIDDYQGKGKATGLDPEEQKTAIRPSLPAAQETNTERNGNGCRKLSGTFRPHTNYHRRTATGHQPYQVDAAPTSLGLSELHSFRTNERMSKKPQKV